MDSTSALGAASPIEVHVSKDGQYLQAPDLVIKPGASMFVAPSSQATTSPLRMACA
jgi:hypothetical protein